VAENVRNQALIRQLQEDLSATWEENTTLKQLAGNASATLHRSAVSVLTNRAECSRQAGLYVVKQLSRRWEAQVLSRSVKAWFDGRRWWKSDEEEFERATLAEGQQIERESKEVREREQVERGVRNMMMAKDVVSTLRAGLLARINGDRARLLHQWYAKSQALHVYRRVLYQLESTQRSAGRMAMHRCFGYMCKAFELHLGSQRAGGRLIVKKVRELTDMRYCTIREWHNRCVKHTSELALFSLQSDLRDAIQERELKLREAKDTALALCGRCLFNEMWWVQISVRRATFQRVVELWRSRWRGALVAVEMLLSSIHTSLGFTASPAVAARRKLRGVVSAWKSRLRLNQAGSKGYMLALGKFSVEVESLRTGPIQKAKAVMARLVGTRHYEANRGRGLRGLLRRWRVRSRGGVMRGVFSRRIVGWGVCRAEQASLYRAVGSMRFRCFLDRTRSEAAMEVIQGKMRTNQRLADMQRRHDITSLSQACLHTTMAGQRLCLSRLIYRWQWHMRQHRAKAITLMSLAVHAAIKGGDTVAKACCFSQFDASFRTVRHMEKVTEAATWRNLGGIRLQQRLMTQERAISAWRSSAAWHQGTLAHGDLTAMEKLEQTERHKLLLAQERQVNEEALEAFHHESIEQCLQTALRTSRESGIVQMSSFFLHSAVARTHGCLMRWHSQTVIEAAILEEKIRADAEMAAQMRDDRAVIAHKEAQLEACAVEMQEDRMADAVLFFSDTLYFWSLQHAQRAIGQWGARVQMEEASFRAALYAGREWAMRRFGAIMYQWQLEASARALRRWWRGAGMTQQGLVTDYATRSAMSLRGIIIVLQGARTALLRRLLHWWNRGAGAEALRLSTEETCLAAERRALERSKRKGDRTSAIYVFRGLVVAGKASAVQRCFASWEAAWRAHGHAVRLIQHQACLRFASVHLTEPLMRRVVATMRMHGALDREAHSTRVSAGKVSGLEKVARVLCHMEEAGIARLLWLWRAGWLQAFVTRATDEAAREEIRLALTQAELEHNASILKWDKLRSADFDARHMATVIRASREGAVRDLRRVLEGMRSAVLRSCLRQFSINRHRYGSREGAMEAVQQWTQALAPSSPFADESERPNERPNERAGVAERPHSKKFFPFNRPEGARELAKQMDSS